MAAALSAVASEGGQIPEELPSVEEQAEMDAAAADLVAKLDAAYDRMEPDDFEGEMGAMDMGALELEDDPEAAGATGRRGRRRKPREKEVPIDLLPKVSTHATSLIALIVPLRSMAQAVM